MQLVIVASDAESLMQLEIGYTKKLLVERSASGTPLSWK
jgi:hypothetical protein